MYHAKGDYDRAIADYTEAIRLNPKYVTAYYNRGLARAAKGDTAKADIIKGDIAKAKQLDPSLGNSPRAIGQKPIPPEATWSRG